MIDDEQACYAAVSAQDARFDGRFVVGVTTTGIFCRPACPARTPRADRCRFYKDAAAAVGAGFRACRRCLPDAAPGSPEWDLRADLAGRAVRLIQDGVVDRDGVDGLAGLLGYSPRQVHRTLVAEVGAGPLALARVRRARAAQLLLERTELTVADVAFASGFGSVRQCNEVVREVYACTPTQLRARRRRRGSPPVAGAAVSLVLPVRLPYAHDAVLPFLAARAVPGVEEITADGRFRRVLRLPHGPGVASVRPLPDRVEVTLRLADPADLPVAVTRLRRLLDTDADPAAVDAHLGADPALAPLVAARPGLRVVGTGEADEAVLRAVLAQQVSTAAARTLAGRLVALAGDAVDDADGALTHAWPTPGAVAEADLAGLGMPTGRLRTLRTVAAAMADGAVPVHPGADRVATLEALGALPGVGPWTLGVVALRCLRDPDAWPPVDLALRRAGQRLGVDDVDRRSAGWAPWRAYAATHLWTSLVTPSTEPATTSEEPR